MSAQREGFLGDILDKVKDLVTDDDRKDDKPEDPPLTPQCCGPQPPGCAGCRRHEARHRGSGRARRRTARTTRTTWLQGRSGQLVTLCAVLQPASAPGWRTAPFGRMWCDDHMPARALDRARELYQKGWAEQAKYRFPPAIRLLKRALVHADRAPDSPERTELRARILYTLGRCVGETSGIGRRRRALRPGATRDRPDRRSVAAGPAEGKRRLQPGRHDHAHGPAGAGGPVVRPVHRLRRGAMRTSPEQVDPDLVQTACFILDRQSFSNAAIRRRELADRRSGTRERPQP